MKTAMSKIKNTLGIGLLKNETLEKKMLVNPKSYQWELSKTEIYK